MKQHQLRSSTLVCPMLNLIDGAPTTSTYWPTQISDSLGLTFLMAFVSISTRASNAPESSDPVRKAPPRYEGAPLLSTPKEVQDG